MFMKAFLYQSTLERPSPSERDSKKGMPRYLCIYNHFSLSLPPNRNNKGKKLLFDGLSSVYSLLSGIGYPAQRWTMPTKQCLQMSLPLWVTLLAELATSISVSYIVLTSAFFVLVATRPPKPETCLQNVFISFSVSQPPLFPSPAWHF